VGADAGADLGAVLGEGGVADVVHRLDGPVPTQQVGEVGGAGLGEGEAGDRRDGHGLGPPTPGAGVQDADGALAGDLQDLSGVGEPEVTDGDGLEGAYLDAAVRLVAGAIQHGHAVPRQGGAAGQQGGLVGLDDKQEVGLLAGHQEPRRHRDGCGVRRR
jgi:hypothetical protein